MTRRSAAVLALRIAVTAGLLVLAILMIDFSDRTFFHLKSGETVEAASWSEKGGVFHAVKPDGGTVVITPGLIQSREEQPGIVTVVKRARLWPAILVIPALILLYFAQGMRWRLILGANGYAVPLDRVFRVTWAGMFFNQILPGSVGGDVAKALIVSKGASRKAGLFGTVLLDRLVGLATVVAIAGLAILPVLGRPELRPVVWLIVALLGGGALGAAAYFSPALRRWKPAQKLKARLPFRQAIEEVDDVLKSMRHAPGTILKAVGLSAVGQAATILAVYSLALSLGIGGVRLGDFFLIEPIVFLVTAVPVSVGGWGVEQVAYAKLFGMAGMAANEAVALSVLYKLAGLMVALPGGLLFAAGATRGKP